jgi:putative colanic acid biosynthesis glycosyltransferase
MSLSIVTIHLQEFANLQETISSIQSVKWISAPQWIVIDGGSKPDNEVSAEVLERVRAYADEFISEPDLGIYDAMNKGTQLASGDFILYLNAGDVFHPEMDPRKLKEAVNTGQHLMIWGDCIERYESGALVRVKTRSEKSAWYGMPACHQAMLFRRSAIGNQPYNLAFKIAADYDLVCRLLAQEPAVLRLKMPLCIFSRGGISDQNLALGQHEFRTIQEQYFTIPRPVYSLVWAFKKINYQVAKIAWLRRLWRRWI